MADPVPSEKPFPIVSIAYLTTHGVRQIKHVRFRVDDTVRAIDGDEYVARAKIEALASQGGWIDERTFVPPHRILLLKYTLTGEPDPSGDWRP